MIKIVIHGASGLKNIGDEAILKSILQKLNTSYDVTVITFNVDYSKKIHPGIRFVKMGSRECGRAVDECDIFILGGGGLFQDETSIYNVSRWLKYLKICIKKEKKTYIYANSVGPVCFKINRILIQKWLKRVEKITVRDKASLKLLNSMGIRENVEVTADPVFSIKKDSSLDIGHFMLPEKYVVICVRHWYDTHTFIPVSICTKLHIKNKKNKEKYRKYIENIAWLADYITEKYYLPIVFLPFLYGRDNNVINDVKRFMKHTGVIVENEYLNPMEAMEIIARSEMLIGMRLHSVIYAAVMGIPALIINYSIKVRAMAEYLHMGNYMMDVDYLSHSEMADMINKIIKNKSEIKRNMNTVTEILQEKEKRNQEVLEDLKDNILMEKSR